MAIWLSLLALSPMYAWSQESYATNFGVTEDPISENGKWINGGSAGFDWTNVRTTSGLVFGTQSGTAGGAARYADSTAVLTGRWGPDQTVEATVSVTNPSSISSVFEEVELRLRTSITAHSITGYEINCSVSNSPQNFYLQIVRWNGPLGSFTYLSQTARHCRNGDVLKATILGNTITVYLNGTQVLQAADNTYKNGNPGIGFFLQGASRVNSSYGFSNFTATDGSIQAELKTLSCGICKRIGREVLPPLPVAWMLD
jgi:hypothetical protein